MQNKILLLSVFFLILSSQASAGDNFEITAQVIAPLELTRTLPSPVTINQPFDVKLNFRNLVDLELFNISIKETIPAGYKIINNGKITPTPSYVGDENGATIVYWNISRMANYTSLSLEYSLSAPKKTGNYNFRADASAIDDFGDKFTAYNVTNQDVKNKKKSLLQNILDILGIIN